MGDEKPANPTTDGRMASENRLIGRKVKLVDRMASERMG
jgi:hypothetical protein